MEKSLEQSKYPHKVLAENLKSFSLPERFEIESVHLEKDWTEFSSSEGGMAVIQAKHLGRSEDDELNVTISALVKKGASQPEKYFIVIDQTEEVTLEYTDGKHTVTYTSITEWDAIDEAPPPVSFRYNKPGKVGFDIVNCSVNVTSSAELPHITIENVDDIQLEGFYDPKEEPNKYFTASIKKLDLTRLKLVYGFFGGKTRFSNLKFAESDDDTAFLENVQIKFQEENTNDFFYLFADTMSFLENRKENVTIQGDLVLGEKKKFVKIQNDKIEMRNGSSDGTIELTYDFSSKFGLDSFANFFLRGANEAALIDWLKKAVDDTMKGVAKAIAHVEDTGDAIKELGSKWTEALSMLFAFFTLEKSVDFIAKKIGEAQALSKALLELTENVKMESVDFIAKRIEEVQAFLKTLSELTGKTLAEKIEYSWALEIGLLIVAVVNVRGDYDADYDFSYRQLFADYDAAYDFSCLEQAVRERDKEGIKRYLEKYDEVDLDFFIKQVKVTFIDMNTPEKKDRIENLQLLKEKLSIGDDEKNKLEEAINFIKGMAKDFSETFGKEQVLELVKLLSENKEEEAEGESEE